MCKKNESDNHRKDWKVLCVPNQWRLETSKERLHLEFRSLHVIDDRPTTKMIFIHLSKLVDTCYKGKQFFLLEFWFVGLDELSFYMSFEILFHK